MKPMLAKTGNEDWLIEIESDPDWVAVKKWDGFRLILYLNNSGNKLLTRSGRNVISNVPQFKPIIPELNDTILDSEGISPEDYLGTVQSVFHSKGIIPNSSKVKLVIFDCLKYKGESLIELPLKERRKFLEVCYNILKQHKWPVKFEKYQSYKKKEFFNDIIREGAEGVMTKDLLASYHPGIRSGAWVKVKGKNTYDFIILGFTKGEGKYRNQIGAIEYGIFYDGQFKKIGKSSGMTDKERLSMSLDTKRHIGMVAEFEAQELTRAGVMRHPRFITLRPDLDAMDITGY